MKRLFLATAMVVAAISAQAGGVDVPVTEPGPVVVEPVPEAAPPVRATVARENDDDDDDARPVMTPQTVVMATGTEPQAGVLVPVMLLLAIAAVVGS